MLAAGERKQYFYKVANECMRLFQGASEDYQTALLRFEFYPFINEYVFVNARSARFLGGFYGNLITNTENQLKFKHRAFLVLV